MTKRSSVGQTGTGRAQASQAGEQATRPVDAVTLPQRWQAAEARLYPLIMVDPAQYEAAVTLVGEASGVLRAHCGTFADLNDADVTGILAQCPSAEVVAASGFDPGVALDAARAHRWRELAAKQAPQMAAGWAMDGDR
ncbi:MAG TPA: hypothetical protein VHT50_16700 [Mycobacterium sp.]|nr:hypothetical protein [Mycobacterium sp.]